LCASANDTQCRRTRPRDGASGDDTRHRRALIREITLIVQQPQHFTGLGADDGHEAVAGGQANGHIAIKAGRDLHDEDTVARDVRRLHVTIAGRLGEGEMTDFGHLRLARAESSKPGLDRGQRGVFVEGAENLRQFDESHGGLLLSECCRRPSPIDTRTHAHP
jgi:hypothetical protein